MNRSARRLRQVSRTTIRALVALLATATLVGAGFATTVFGSKKPIEKRGSASVEFTRDHSPLALEKADLARRAEMVEWPVWGLSASRTRVVPGHTGLRPPFKVRYVVPGRALIEFPPVVAYNRLFFGTHRGLVVAARVRNGKVVWTRDLKRCIAASPAVGGGVVYVAAMGPAPCRPQQKTTGALFALDAYSGRTLWRLDTGMIESSPLLVKNILYFASYDEHEQSIVYALNVRTHRARWRFAVPAKVTSSPALFSDRLYFGSYAGMLYALRARTGKLVFAVRPPGKTGNSSGFYGTPALAYGRVYIGGINGMVYAFGARSGALQWATSTGSDVYSSPAVWRGKVYAGSYKNHRFFAFNAATGRILWSFRADGNILGSPTILAGLVYFSTTSGLTYALDARTGAEVWRFADGQYSPLAVAGGRVLLTGKGRIYGLDPIRPKPSSKKNARSK